MDIRKISSIKAVLALSGALALGGCFGTGAEEDKSPAQEQDGVVKSDFILGKVGVLSKTATINLRRVYFTLTSSAGETIQDSADATGNEQVIITKTWTLKPLRTWTITARSKDGKDSVIHQGTTNSFFVKPADTVSVNLSLVSRFTMYEARFQALPDSVSSSASGTGKDKVNLGQLTLKIDNVTRADSVKTGYFAGAQTVVLYYDYITTGSHTVVLEASGKLNSFEGVLYRGSATFNVAAGADETRAVTLDWVGPTTGSGKLTVTLGRVGKVQVNGTLPGTVIP
jgi:hypothetical protein